MWLDGEISREGPSRLVRQRLFRGFAGWPTGWPTRARARGAARVSVVPSLQIVLPIYDAMQQRMRRELSIRRTFKGQPPKRRREPPRLGLVLSLGDTRLSSGAKIRAA